MLNILIKSETDYATYLKVEKQYFEENYGKKITENNVTPDDFETTVLLGIGSFGKVFLVRKRMTGEFYAMKILIKSFLVNTKQVDNTLSEKQILECLRSPFTINMIHFCMTNSFIYFVLPFIPGGEMFHLLREQGSLPEEEAKFYAAQVLLGLEYLHNLDLAYRDLKPENLLIDCFGYVKIADFGFCKIVKGRTYTLCGTPDYIAPEVILNKGHSKAVDFWSYGVLIYEMCAGFPPFIAPNLVNLYERIASAKYAPNPFFTRELKDLIKKFLKVDTTQRLGNLCNGYYDIKRHVWFKSTDWLGLINRKIRAPFIPSLSGPSDSHYFDEQEDKLKLQESVTDHYVNEFMLF